MQRIRRPPERVGERLAGSLLRHLPDGHAGGANEHADVEPAVIVAVDQVGLVARIGLSGGDRVGVDARRQRLQHLERLDLLHGQQVRRLEDRTNLPRQLGQAHRQGRAGHDGIVVVRRVDRIEQPIGVQRGGRELGGSRQRQGRCCRAGRARRHDRSALDEDGVGPLAVVQRTDQLGDHRAGRNVERRQAQRRALDAQPLEVGVEERDGVRGVERPAIVDVHTGLAERPRQARHDAVEDAGIGSGRRDDAERRDADAHAFEALEAVDDAAGRRVGGGQGNGGRKRLSGATRTMRLATPRSPSARSRHPSSPARRPAPRRTPRCRAWLRAAPARSRSRRRGRPRSTHRRRRRASAGRTR